ncbi:Methyltransferase domain-containing protein [Singulisphaera sp. GP187]|uniref:class I SAM-dependent methyltransferase n=1 Tax=Singulisphaera sp. GP187 TaxID=1882752 RepID=UPI000929247A|nr:class I SAM-dependent methyltransferase [Singulisphaera sp. GP187]SIO15172.1 Methyltransferase domain-containing protein [Singulisphaera sp. GP187]
MTAVLTIEQPAYFDRLAEVEAAHWWSRGMWRLGAHWLDAALRGCQGLAALDVGCGTGQTALRLACRPEVGSVVGLDPSAEALAHARRRHTFPLVRGSALDLPFNDSKFDVITCFDVLQHLPQDGDRRAVGELHRVLAPGGVALVRSNAQGWTSASPAVEGGYRLGDLVKLFEASGFTVRHATHANCLPALVQELRGRLARPGRGGPSSHPSGGGLKIQLPHPWVNRVMGGVATAEAVVAGRLSTRLPFGHSTMLLVSRRHD